MSAAGGVGDDHASRVGVERERAGSGPDDVAASPGVEHAHGPVG